MENTTLRTFGATVILAVLVGAGVSQVVASGSPVPAEIAVESTSTTHAPSTTTTEEKPFVYRLGVLAGLSTDNFWAFYGREPSVWNSYVLGPTKPALFTQADVTATLEGELAKGMVRPELADSGWHVLVDLRDDLAWSDGTPVTAGDFVFTFDTVRRLDLEGSWSDAFPDIVDSVAAEGDHRLRIEFRERPGLAVWPYGVGVAPIMARHVWEPLADVDEAERLYTLSGAADVGGGPLTLAHTSETRITSVANDGYPGSSVPDVVEYSVFADKEAAVAALGAGEIDAVLSPGGIGQASFEGSGIEKVTSPGNSVRYLGFNLRRQPMADKEFREALALLLDREDLSAEIGAGPPAWSLVPAANTRWYAPAVVESITKRFRADPPRRLATALEGLAAAGYRWEQAPSVDEGGEWRAGKGLTIDGVVPQPVTILTPGDEYDPSRVDYVEAIASVLGVLGFDARPVVTDFDTVVDLVLTADDSDNYRFDMYVLGWTLGDPALPRYYGALFGDGGALNNTGYGSEEFAAALASFEGALSNREAKAALWEMESVLARDLPYLPLYNSEIVEAYRSDRVDYDGPVGLGGWQARLGGIREVRPVR